MRSLEMRFADQPAWYRLSFAADPVGIRVDVHPAALQEALRRFRDRWRAVDDAKLAASLPPWIPPDGAAPWGYGPALLPDGERSGWTGWRCAFPSIHLGRDGRHADWRAAQATSASLVELFDALNAVATAADGGPPQVLTVAMTLRDHWCYGATIEATISAWTAARLASLDAGDETRITAAMHQAISALHGGDAGGFLDECSFRMQGADRPLFRMFGAACGLGPGFKEAWPSGAFDLSPHNTDSPFQQLALLAGLAAFHEALERR